MKHNNSNINPADMEPVAGNGLLHRRLFMQQGLSLSLATMTVQSANAADDKQFPQWLSRPGKPFSNYGQPSAHEKTIRWIAETAGTTTNGLSWSPIHQLEGTITPNGLHFERHHNGVPEIDPLKHELLIHGLVEKPLKFSVENLLLYPMQSRVCFIECGGNSSAGWRDNPIQTPLGYFHGMISCSEWTGVPLHYLLEECGIKPSATWVIAEGGDGFSMKVSIPLEKLLDDAILALYQNGERIRPENGYPVRLLLPGWEGVTNVKWIRRLRFTDRPVMSRNETAKYTDLLSSGKARQFTFEMQAKSMITSPSFGMHLRSPGLYQISGLAWSGAGKIRQVDISVDGGQSWAKAALDEPVLSKSLTRFRIPWQWDGSPSIIKSRAIDEAGYQQPEREELVKQRGKNGYFHYNGVVSWKILEQGNIEHTYETA